MRLVHVLVAAGLVVAGLVVAGVVSPGPFGGTAVAQPIIVPLTPQRSDPPPPPPPSPVPVAPPQAEPATGSNAGGQPDAQASQDRLPADDAPAPARP